MNRRMARRLAFVVVQGSMLVLAFALATTSAVAAPNGNTGTVKIDGVAFAEHHANEPHPSCDFRVTFWGYGIDRLATVSFALQSPTKETTGSGTTSSGPIDVGADPAGGGNDPDGAYLADLASFLEESGATPHAKQGYHVKLTVNAPGSQGADVKHKVFWLDCATEVQGTTPREPRDETTVLGTKFTRGGSLAITGISIRWTALIAAQMLLLGVAMVMGSRSRGSVVRVKW